MFRNQCEEGSRVEDFEDRFLTLQQLSRYTGLSTKMLARFIHDPRHPLPAHRFGVRLRVRKNEFDAWLREREGFASQPREPASKEMAFNDRVARELRGYPVEK
jgi:excisionase family DNA binding protein